MAVRTVVFFHLQVPAALSSPYTKDEFYAIAFRKKIYRSPDELQADLDQWVDTYNTERTHSGKYCYGKIPMETFLNSKQLVHERLLDRLAESSATAESAA